MAVVDTAVAQGLAAVELAYGLESAATLRAQTWAGVAQTARARLDAANQALQTFQQLTANPTTPQSAHDQTQAILQAETAAAATDPQTLLSQLNGLPTAGQSNPGGGLILTRLRSELQSLLSQANARQLQAQSRTVAFSSAGALVSLPAQIAAEQSNVAAATADTQLAKSTAAAAASDQTAWAACAARVQPALAATQAAQAAITATPALPADLEQAITQLSNMIGQGAWQGYFPPSPDVVPGIIGGLDARAADDLAAGVLAAVSRLTVTDPGAPVALLPVRVETHFPLTADGRDTSEIQIRVYPDELHADFHEPELTANEIAWGAALWQASAGQGGADSAMFAQLVERFGAPRAAWIATTTRTPASVTTRPGPWTRPALARVLPDRWLALAYSHDGRCIGTTCGAPVQPHPMPLGVDPASAQPDPAGPPTDPNSRWLVDFTAAENNGMGLRLKLSPATGAAGVAQVLVLGVQTPAPGGAAAELAALLQAHRYTDGLEVIAPGTSAHTSPVARSGFSTAPVDPAVLAGQVGAGAPPSDSDATQLADALALDASVFAAAQTDVRPHDQDAEAMNTVVWSALVDPFLDLIGLSGPLRDDARAHFLSYVRARGPLPPLRIGRQPYGALPVLPATQLAGSTDPLEALIVRVHDALRPSWSAATTQVGPSLPIAALLQRRATGDGLLARGLFTLTTDDGAPFIDGLADQTPAQVQAATQSYGAGIAQILGNLGAPTTWAQDGMLYPDPGGDPPPGGAAAAGPTGPGPWPVTGGDGQLPLIAAPPLSPTDPLPAATNYLRQLAAAATVDPTAAQPAVLAYLVAYALTRTTNPADHQQLVAAVTHLASVPSATLVRLLPETIDLTSHRLLDSWTTSLATRRLRALRGATPGKPAGGLILGGYGYVENLSPPTDAPVATSTSTGATIYTDIRNRGYQHAPSPQQAVTAAVLRSGSLPYGPSVGPVQPGSAAPFAVDLSSSRARTARFLLDGIGNGQPLGALLGYQFERTLRENDRGSYIATFRKLAPLNPAAPDPTSASASAPVETVLANDVLDGVALAALAMAGTETDPTIQALFADPTVKAALDELVGSFDAVADAVLAESVHHAIAGNPARAGATLASMVTEGHPPPDLSFLTTPQSGVAVTHRVILTIGPAPPATPATNTPPTNGNAASAWRSDTPRALADPRLAAWAAALLGPPTAITAQATYLGGDGQPLTGQAGLAVTLDELDLAAIDVLTLALRPSELDARIANLLLGPGRRPSAVPPTASIVVDPAPSNLGASARTLADTLALATLASRLLHAGHPLDARHLATPGTADSGIDYRELVGRTQAAQSALTTACDAVQGARDALDQALKSAAAADGTALRAALVALAAFGVGGAIPATADGNDPLTLSDLVQQADAASGAARRRLAAAQAIVNPSPNPAEPDQLAADAAALLDQLAAIFADTNPALPLFHLPPGVDPHAAVAGTESTLPDPAQGPLAWLTRIARARPAVAALEALHLACEALGATPRRGCRTRSDPHDRATARRRRTKAKPLGRPAAGARPTGQPSNLTRVRAPGPPGARPARALMRAARRHRPRNDPRGPTDHGAELSLRRATRLRTPGDPARRARKPDPAAVAARRPRTRRTGHDRPGPRTQRDAGRHHQPRPAATAAGRARRQPEPTRRHPRPTAVRTPRHLRRHPKAEDDAGHQSQRTGDSRCHLHRDRQRAAHRTGRLDSDPPPASPSGRRST